MDYSNIDQLVETLKGVEAVISTFSGKALGEPQHNLANAAKKAGVLLFVPSEFGLPTHALSEESVSRLLYYRSTTGQLRGR